MKRKGFKRIVACAAALLMFCAMPVQAAGTETYHGVPVEAADSEQTIVLDGGNSSVSTAYGLRRGSIISTAIVELTNKGGGDLGGQIMTLAQVECEEIRHTAILEEKQNDGSWEEVVRYEYVANKKDFPTEVLSSLSNSFVVKNQTIGRYYRLRGIHSVWANGESQAFTTQTEEVLATKYGG